MSFKVAYSDVVICNRALLRLPEAAIPNLEFRSPAARECVRFYKPVVRQMLEAHDWGLAQKRETLAESSTNAHPGYLYCYEEPNDLAFLIAVEHSIDARGQQFGVGRIRQRFERMGGKIYSNVANAVAVYTSLDITENDFNEQFVLAVELHLASRLAMPITKKKDLADKLEQQANAHVNLAIANYRNQQGYTYGHEYSETDSVRGHGSAQVGVGEAGLASDFPAYSGFAR
ncbi:MAG: hypothetical protein ACRCWJ_15110 [Casimicrobium sp.]